MKQDRGWNPILRLPIAEIIPEELAPTNLDFDWVFNIEWICIEKLNQATFQYEFSYSHDIMNWNVLGNNHY